MDAICPRPHPHGAVYLVQMHDGEPLCPWCNWLELMKPVPGQYVKHRDLDPWLAPNTFADERALRRARELDTNASRKQILIERAARIRHACL